MQDALLHFFEKYPQLAVLLSLALSILVAILGVVPSVFITAANILFFGCWNGTLLSVAGEAAGAAIAFLLYRAGFKKIATKKLLQYPKIQQLVQASNKKAFYTVFSLRLLPFVPSGLITFGAAVGRIPFLFFLIASTLGKIPALLLEAYAVYEITAFGSQGKVLLAVIATGLLIWIFRKKAASTPPSQPLP